MLHDLIVDALNEGSAKQWRRRAEQFRAARPTATDAAGSRSREELRAKWRELDGIARACDNKAAFIEAGYEDWPDLDNVLAELAASPDRIAA